MSLNLGIISSSRTIAPSTPLLLDVYTGAAAAYSLRKLRTAYTGAAIRVRRDIDNVETDIGFNSSNELDTTALSTFIGANNGFITRWYDQSGNVRDVAQVNTSYQPSVVSSGVISLFGSKPSLYFSPTKAMSNNSFTLNQPNTYFIVTQGTSANLTGDRNIFDGTGSNRNAIGKSNVNANYFMYAGTLVYSTTLVDTIKNLFVSIFNTTTSSLYKNGASILSNANPGSLPIGGIRIGAYLDGQGHWESYIPEFIAYNSNQSINLLGINTNINSFYSIYWQGTGNALLDLYPSAAAAYSLRNLSSTYLGPLVRVRRSSDNVEQDIYGTFAGQLNTDALLAFCGAGDGFVSIWYDQSGNARNLNQTNTSLQPSIVISGVLQIVNTRPTIYIDGISQNLVATISLSSTTYFFDVLKTADTTFTLYHSGDSSAFILQTGTQSSTNTAINYNAVVNSTYKNNVLQTAPTTRGDVYNLISTNTQILLSYNTTLTNWVQVNLSGYSGFQFNVYQQEIIIYNNNQAANLSGINSNINSYYTIY